MKEGNGPWRILLGVALLVIFALLIFQQLTRDGGLTQPGVALDGARLLFQGAVVSLLLAALLDWRFFLRSLVSLPVILLAALAALTLASASWSTFLDIEAERYGLLIFGYAAICLSGAVLSARFGAFPLVLLVVVASTATAGFGLWAFAAERIPYAVDVGALVPAGPYRYKNALALTSAAALLPLIRGISLGGRSLIEIAVFVLSALALGICAVAVALSDSEFALAFAALILAAVLIWPASLTNQTRQQSIGAVVATAVVAVAGYVLFRSVVEAGPDERTTRMLVMVALVAATPLVAWGLGYAAGRLPDRFVRFTPAIAIGAGLLGICLLLVVGASSVGGDVTQARLDYYEVTIEAAMENPVKGTGSGSYSDATVGLQAAKLWTTTRFAHSIPGEMWVELGLGGLVIALLLYAAAARASWRAFRIPFAVLLAPMVIGFLLNGLIDWNWHFAAITALWAIALGGLAGARLGRDFPAPPAPASPATDPPEPVALT